MHAEFKQTGYLRIRQLEEDNLMFNYLDEDCNPAFKSYINSQVGYGEEEYETECDILTARDRSYGIRKILEL